MAKVVEAASGALQLLMFKLGVAEYGIDIRKVEEIIRIQEITHVARMPDFIEGIINLRGNVIPVIDLRRRFGLAGAERRRENRIIIIGLENRTLGLIVDEVSEVENIESNQIASPPPGIAEIGDEFLEGICKLGKRLIVLLKVEAILSAGEKSSLSTI